MIEAWGLTLLSVGLLLIATLCISFLAFNFLGDLLGAPFVPTSAKAVGQILKRAKLKKDQVFVELGSGDGRLIIMAVKNYGVHGIGVEINPLLVWYSRLMARLSLVSNLQFRQENLFNTDLRLANVIFFFLTPRTIKKVINKITQQCQPKTLIISHGFKIRELDQCLIDIIERPVFSTYFYSLRSSSGLTRKRK